MADHDTHDHTGVPGCGAPADILDIPTAETDASLVLAPDGAGGVEFRAEAGGGGTTTTVLDTFTRADGAVGHASGGPQQLWLADSGTWAISSNTLTETGGGSERFIFLWGGYQVRRRTITWVLNNKGSGGDGGLIWRAKFGPSSSGDALLLNLEATYKLYRLTSGGTYTAVTVDSGTPAAPANGDSIVVSDDGIEISVAVNGGSPVVYHTTGLGGPFVGFRSASSTTIKHESIEVVDG